MKIVITGAEGFIGSVLRRQCLAAGIEVMGVDIAAQPIPGNEVIDVRSPDLVEVIPSDATAIVHLAALSRDRDCVGRAPEAIDINVAGTVNVFRAAATRGVPQLIFASSEWVYGDFWGEEPMREDSPIDATRIASEYALSKLMAERFLFIENKRDPRVSVTVLRFGIVYGPRTDENWSAVEQLSHAVRTSDVVELRGSARSARRFIHVSDIAGGIRQAIGRQGYEVFNLAGDQLVTLADVIAENAALLGRTPRVVERDPGAVGIRNPDNSLARETLDWQPLVGLREGLSTLFPNR